MASVEAVRRLALSLPRTEESLVRDRVKFRVGRLVYLVLSADETLMGFAFPKEERTAPACHRVGCSAKSAAEYSLGSTSTSQLPELSRITASTPYGRSAGSCRNSTPAAESSS